MAARQLVIPLLLSALLGYLYFNRIQTLFFNGAYVDLGTWAHLAYSPTAFHQDPSTYYPSLFEYFCIHFRPVFLLLSTPSVVLPLNLVDNISLIFAAQAMLIAISAAIAVLALRLPLRPLMAGLLATATGLAFYLSAPNLSALGYPHFEALFAPLTVLFFVAYATGHSIWAALVLVILLSVREDMGLHVGLFILSFAAYVRLVHNIAWSKISFLVGAGLLALIYSVLARLIQLHYFPGGHVLVRDYLNDPLYAHVTKELLAQRLSSFWEKRGYLLIAFAATLALASYYRRPVYLLGYVVYLPWLVFNLLAVKHEAGALSTYRMYPFALALIWPVVYEVLRFNRLDVGNVSVRQETAPRGLGNARQGLALVLATILICASTTLVAQPSLAPVNNLKPPKSAARQATLFVITLLNHDQHHRLGLRVSRSVAAVGSSEIKNSDVIGKERHRSDLPSGNGVLFHASARDACEALRYSGESGFNEILRLDNSRIFVALRSEQRDAIVNTLREQNKTGLRLVETSSADRPLLQLHSRCKKVMSPQGGSPSSASNSAMMGTLVKQIASCIVAQSPTISFIAPASAADRPTTEIECQKAGMTWKQESGKCKLMGKSQLSPTEKVLALIGLACAFGGICLVYGLREVDNG